MSASAHATPQTPRRRRNHKGVDIHTGHRCARPRTKSNRALFGGLVFPRAERSDGPCGCLVFGCPNPLWPCREAQWRADQGSRLFERAARVQRDPVRREHRRLPEAKRRVTDSRVAFSLVTFSWRRKRKLLRRRAHTPAPVLCHKARTNQKTTPSTQPATMSEAPAQLAITTKSRP